MTGHHVLHQPCFAVRNRAKDDGSDKFSVMHKPARPQGNASEQRRQFGQTVSSGPSSEKPDAGDCPAHGEAARCYRCKTMSSREQRRWKVRAPRAPYGSYQYEPPRWRRGTAPPHARPARGSIVEAGVLYTTKPPPISESRFKNESRTVFSSRRLSSDDLENW